MTNQLQDQLALVISKALELAEKGGQFVLDQAPDLIRQFLQWRLFIGVTNIIFVSLLVIIVYKITSLLGKKNRENSYDKIHLIKRWYDEKKAMWFVIINVIMLIIAFIILYCMITDIIQILIAPKIYLLEYFTK